MSFVSGSCLIFGSTKKTTGMSTDCPAFSVCSVKQKQAIFLKYLPAWSGAGTTYDDHAPPPRATLTVETGVADPILGATYAQIGESLFVSENTVISQWTIRGTSTNGERIEVHGCDFYTFRDGKIIKKDSYWKIREP